MYGFGGLGEVEVEIWSVEILTILAWIVSIIEIETSRETLFSFQPLGRNMTQSSLVLLLSI